MPVPTLEDTKTAIAQAYVINGTFNTNIVKEGEFCVRMSNGIVNGWTCVANQPTSADVPSTFQTEIISQFSAYTLAGSHGLLWITCVGQNLDEEVALWIAGWVGDPTDEHTYIPSASAIVTRIEACQPINSDATTKMNQVIADWFVLNFEQEGA